MGISSLYIPVYQVFPWILVAIGFYTAFRILNFPDLTVDASFVAGSVGAAVGAIHFSSSGWGLLLSMLVSGLAGGLTAMIYLTNPRPVYKLLSGVLVIFVYYSVVWRMLGSKLLVSFTKAHTFINLLIAWDASYTSNDYRLGLSLMGLLVVLGVLVFLYWFYSTNFGLKLRAVATRPNLIANRPSELAQILLPGLVISNMIVGIGGWLHASSLSMSQIVIFGYIIHGLASAILGELVVDFVPFLRRGNKYSLGILLVTPVVGAVIYFFLRAIVASWLLSELASSGGTEFRFSTRDTETLVAGLIIFILLVLNRLKPDAAQMVVEDESPF